METEDGCEPVGVTSNSTPTTFQRSCDTCRSRKIRCDREQPCSHCSSSNTPCTYTDKLKPREKKTRILLTSQYEKKIDQIDRRLEQVVGLLQTLPLNAEQTAHASLSSTGGSPGTLPADAGLEASSVMEGESSLAAQFTFADDFMQKVARGESPSCTNPGGELQENLKVLSQIVSSYKQHAVTDESVYPHARLVHRPSFHGCELPPIQETVAVIRVAESQRLAGTGWIYEYLPMQQFSKTCLEVYFSEQYTETDFIIVTAGLHSIFKDYSNIVSGEEKERCLKHANLCRAHLETALSGLPLHLPATSKTIIALVFGATHSIELSKPFLAWSLSSKASELCQSLGYHRAASVDNGNEEDVRLKKLLFWSTYFIDKSLSLRLGRASTIPEWTITTSRPSVTDFHQQPAMAYFVLWVETARCQGNIYEMLYGPDSVIQPDDVRQARVQRLVSDLGELEKATQETNRKWIQESKTKAGEDLIDFYAASDETLRLSLLTMVHRAAPRPPGSTTTFSLDCVVAARSSLEKHRQCVGIIKKSGNTYFPAYFQWSLLFAPFVPYIVMFCHVIETQDQTDLDRLGDFSCSIQNAAQVSEAAFKAFHLFHTLHGIAVRYLELCAAHPQNGQRKAGPEMDWFLEALGIAPPGQENDGQRYLASDAPWFGTDLIDSMEADGARDNDTTQRRTSTTQPLFRVGNEVELESWFQNNEAGMDFLRDTDIGFGSNT
ncbi:fungal specific transcription factor domain-containing protein [Colletotrichum chrysophilum]|uniref:Fungal specific transcription factor domain-containing protein n=1 Tax=Colletotrichum chrysophilum TaxID=1836956 RepID=A0AAD9A396_9PEZI|nr:fungal specific transcription factor domain-containing protein [Colletotrichum chrysophilum]